MSDYGRIEKAIAYLVEHATEQPGLQDVAAHVQMSPFHFQRMFGRWAGTTPKRFLQVLTLEHGKRLLEESRSLLDVSDAVGLSGPSRLHDHFVTIEAVTPGEYKTGGRGLDIEYGIHDTPFGAMFVAVTPRGICRAGFVEHTALDEALGEIRRAWPQAQLVPNERTTRDAVAAMFRRRSIGARGREAWVSGIGPSAHADGSGQRPLSLHVSGTNFQLAVWHALLRIPEGAVVSYADLARLVDRPRASRAVGNAVGANPVALLIPCHRVIRESGALGDYRWGASRKRIIQTWERMQIAQPPTARSDTHPTGR